MGREKGVRAHLGGQVPLQTERLAGDTPLPALQWEQPCFTHLLLVELTTDMGWFESSFTTRMLFCRGERKTGAKGWLESRYLPFQPPHPAVW